MSVQNLKAQKPVRVFSNTKDIRKTAYNAGLCEDKISLQGLREQYPGHRTDINREWTRGAICALEANGEAGTSKHKLFVLAMKSLEKIK